MILESPYTSCIRVITDSYPYLNSALDRCIDIFVNIKKIKKINCPIIMFHGKKDKVVPYYHSNELWKLAKNKYKKIMIDNADHDNLQEIILKKCSFYLKDFVNVNTEK